MHEAAEKLGDFFADRANHHKFRKITGAVGANVPIDEDLRQLSWADLHTRRKAAVRAMSAILDKAEAEKRDMSDDEDAVHTALYNMTQLYNREFEHRDNGGVPHAWGGRGVGTGGRSSEPEYWSDKEGRRIPVLGPEHRIADHIAHRGEPVAAGVGFGHCVRAMVMGARNADERRALQEGLDTAGGLTVPTQLAAGILDLMRKKNRLIQAGARTIPMETAELTFARLASDPSISWHNESEAIAESTGPTFDATVLHPTTAVALVKVTRELLQDSANIETVLRDAFAQAMALEVQRVAFYGDGVKEPLGLINQPDNFKILEIDKGTNGGPFQFDDLIDGVGTLLQNDAEAPTATIMSAREWETFNKLKDGEGNHLINTGHPVLQDNPILPTTAIKTDETKGTASNASRIFMGEWPQLVIAVRSDLRVEVLRELYAENYQFGFLAHMRLDIGVLQEKAFVQINGTTV